MAILKASLVGFRCTDIERHLIKWGQHWLILTLNSLFFYVDTRFVVCTMRFPSGDCLSVPHKVPLAPGFHRHLAYRVKYSDGEQTSGLRRPNRKAGTDELATLHVRQLERAADVSPPCRGSMESNESVESRW